MTEQPPEPSLATLGRMMRDLPHPVVIHRLGRILWANRAALQITGATELSQLVGRQLTDFVVPTDHARAQQRITDLYRNGQLVDRAQFVGQRLDGQQVVVETTAALMDWDGETVSCLVVWDVTGHHQQERQLHFDATHDPLTGLLNRRGILEEMEHWDGDGEGYAVVILDLDGFKAINDTLGHEAGDRILRDVAEQLKQLGGGHLIGRFGGDEFLIGAQRLSLDATQVLARQVAEIRAALRNADHLVAAPSVGAAWSPSPDLERLIEAADHAMYGVKRSGRGWALTALEDG